MKHDVFHSQTLYIESLVHCLPTGNIPSSINSHLYTVTFCTYLKLRCNSSSSYMLWFHGVLSKKQGMECSPEFHFRWYYSFAFQTGQSWFPREPAGQVRPTNQTWFKVVEHILKYNWTNSVFHVYAHFIIWDLWRSDSCVIRQSTGISNFIQIDQIIPKIRPHKSNLVKGILWTWPSAKVNLKTKNEWPLIRAQ